MFFAYAEKRSGAFSGKWELRQLAFDTTRRYLYISDRLQDPSEIAPPQGFPLRVKQPTQSSAALDEEYDEVTPARLVSSRAPSRRNSGLLRSGSVPIMGTPGRLKGFPEECPPMPPSVPLARKWKKKVFIDVIEVVHETDPIDLQDGLSSENDVFQVAFYGEERKLHADEKPNKEPMLCPSADFTGDLHRFSINNPNFLRDPMYLRELFDALQEQFHKLQAMHDNAQQQQQQPGSGDTSGQEGSATAGSTPEHGRSATNRTSSTSRTRQSQRLTLRTPREGDEQGLGAGEEKGYKRSLLSRTRQTLRFRNEYELRRFLYITQMVLGYDKAGRRPYSGLPPYDPRNGVVFEQLPMYAWLQFKKLDKVVLYIFTRGQLVGHTLKGDINIFLHGAFLCISHDRVIVFRENSSIARWMRMEDICRVEYNVYCGTPFVAFVSDTGAPDIVFIPGPPTVGRDAIQHFSRHVEVMRIVQVVRSVFFASMDVRRAIILAESHEKSVRAFVSRLETELERRLNFDPRVVRLGSESQCDPPNETALDAWRGVRSAYARYSMDRASHTAIPLYDGHPNSEVFEPELLQEMAMRMERERSAADEVVGMNEVSQSQLRSRLRGVDSADVSRHDAAVERLADSSESDVDSDGGLYGVPGSTYLTEDGEPVSPPVTSPVPEKKPRHGGSHN